MSWGTRIVIAFILFFILVAVVFTIASSQRVDLVTEDYYAKEIEYQDQIDRMTRANELSEQLAINYDGSSLLFSFPKTFIPAQIEGNIHFYRPSDAREDKQFPIKLLESHELKMNGGDFSKGLWKIKVDWSVNDIEYFNEKKLMID
ncbi:MAG: FixH family protein [Melioribacteraceae bacterium]|nr:FixH family protein [Melioribacteraceae bacterium]MCF8355700.1 FixH family protein [Melioribacteraceae bacterium]MCF8394430.1 FixH family protein [Melioribacteraceae bacterium]MCF8418564.1 FixH family protein [Melioribacteraceae bacterium]